MKKHRIEPCTWRYHLAQWCLKLIFGNRKEYYISPWKHAAAGMSVFLHYDGKILYALRSGNIEGAGKWCNLGGHIDFEKGETSKEAAIREVYEEVGIDVADRIDEPFSHVVRHDKQYFELADASIIKMAFLVELNDELVSQLKTSEEVADFKFIDQSEYFEMYKNGQTFGEPYYQRIAFEKIANSAIVPS